jgi:hypothetical protein
MHNSPDSTNVVQEDMEISYSEDSGMIILSKSQKALKRGHKDLNRN